MSIDESDDDVGVQGSTMASRVRSSFELQLGKRHVSFSRTDPTGKAYVADDSPKLANPNLGMRVFPTFAKDSAVLIEILQAPLGGRKRWELEAVANMCQGVDLFRNLEYEVQLQLCNFLSYEFVKEKETIFSQGDVGSKFFIMVDGQVAVSVRNAFGNIDDPSLPKVKRMQSRTTDLRPGGGLLGGGVGDVEEGLAGARVATLQAGDTFGELALVGKGDELRQATVIAEQDCHLLVIEKENYHRMLAGLHESEMRDKEMWLRKIPIFRGVPESELSKISHVAQIRKYPSMSVIFRQGWESDAVYFVRKGHVRLINEVEVSEQEFHQLCVGMHAGRRNTSVRPPTLPGRGEPNPTTSSDGFLRAILPLPESPRMEKERESKSYAKASGSTWMHPFFSRGKKVELSRSNAPRKKLMIQVDTVGPRMMFGEIGVASQTKRRLTAVCSTNVELLVLSRIDFYSKLKPDTIRAFRRVARSMGSDAGGEAQVKEKLFQRMKWEAYKVRLLDELDLGPQRFS